MGSSPLSYDRTRMPKLLSSPLRADFLALDAEKTVEAHERLANVTYTGILELLQGDMAYGF